MNIDDMLTELDELGIPSLNVEWQEKRFILPKVCYITNKRSGWFPKMYVGTRYFGDEFAGFPPDTWLVSHAGLVFAKLASTT